MASYRLIRVIGSGIYIISSYICMYVDSIKFRSLSLGKGCVVCYVWSGPVPNGGGGSI